MMIVDNLWSSLGLDGILDIHAALYMLIESRLARGISPYATINRVLISTLRGGRLLQRDNGKCFFQFRFQIIGLYDYLLRN